jgi:hypothetical protein
MTTVRQEIQHLEEQTRKALRDINDAEHRISINSDYVGAVLDLQRASGRLLFASERIAFLAEQMVEEGA